jgi:hypothetical protein
VAGFMYSSVLFEGSFEDAIAFPVEFMSTLPARFGLSTLDQNWAEGVVVKRATELRPPRRFLGSSEAASEMPRHILKRKAPRFAEKCYDLATKPQIQLSSSLVAGEAGFQLEFVRYELCASAASEARLAAVLSKRGRPDWGDPKACRALVRALVTDSVEDLEASSLCLSPSLCERGNRQKERAGIPAKFQVLLARAAPHKMNLTARCFCLLKANERQLFEDLPITHRCEFLGPAREAAKATIKVYSMRPC